MSQGELQRPDAPTAGGLWKNNVNTPPSPQELAMRMERRKIEFTASNKRVSARAEPKHDATMWGNMLAGRTVNATADTIALHQ